MLRGALLDTGFLIQLADPSKPFYDTAKQWFDALLARRQLLYLSTIVISEFCLKQKLESLPRDLFQYAPFTVAHAMECARLDFKRHSLSTGKPGERDVIKDDMKIIAQAKCLKTKILLTNDKETMYRYASILKKHNDVAFTPVLLSDGFDPAILDVENPRGVQQSFW